jgi:hypothetical protein
MKKEAIKSLFLVNFLFQGDRPWLLEKYGKALKIAVATGEVSHDERVTILDHF